MVVVRSKPLSVAFSKPFFQFFWLATAAVLLWEVSTVTLSSIEHSGSPWPLRNGSTVAFTALALRDGSTPPSSLSIGEFGLLRDGCRAPGRIGSLSAANETVSLLLSDIVPANGFFFVTGAGPAGAGPVRWRIELRGPDGGAEMIGASVWRMSSQSGRSEPLFLLPSLDYPTPAMPRGHQVRTDGACSGFISRIILRNTLTLNSFVEGCNLESG